MELNVDQMRIVNSKPNGHVLIKGVAGSGKTTVAVSKISTLINHYMDEQDKILFVTYNKTLIEYTRYLIQDMDIQKNIFFEFDMEKQLEVKTIDSIIASYGYRLSPRRDYADSRQTKNIMLKAIVLTRKNYPELELLSEKNYPFLNEEIDWLKSCRYIERETYINIDRVGRMSRGENRYRLLKKSVERNAIFDVYLCYEELLEKEGLTDYKTNAIRVLQALTEGKIKPNKYRHVIVDESQDLTRVQLEIIRYMYHADKESASIMFIADVSQSIYHQSWLSGQSFKSVGFDMSGKSNILSKNYRTTYEIAQAAYSLIEKDDTMKQNDNFVKPVAIDRHGDAPFYKHYSDIEKEAEGIAVKIKQLVNRYSLKDIVVVAANRQCLEHIQSVFLKKGIPVKIFNKAEGRFDEDVVRLYTIHSVKGLEFPVLFIAAVNEGVLPYSEDEVLTGRRLLYVGMTRAQQELYLSSSDKKSRFIDEMDMNLFSDNEEEFADLYKVDISEYLFQDKLHDIYSREEMVRQWFIRELIVRKKYPVDNIDIEYPVQLFSKKGYADVVVYNTVNGKKEPYMLAEIKQPDEDMDRAMKQLCSYTACCPKLEYVVVTDGKMLQIKKVHNNDFSDVRSIPVYKESEAGLFEVYEYIDWASKRQYIYEINCEDKDEIVIKNFDSKEVMETGNYNSINIIGEVAAGVLKYANMEVLGDFRLPELLTGSKKDLFMLKVNGDSMIDFQINDGDHVLIKKQQSADNGDIVVAGKLGENEVTLKQYCNFGGTVGLMPGNKSYSPIMIPEDELFINGILVGVLKAYE